MNTLTVKAPAISCGHCVKTIQTEVAEITGVQAVKADEKTKMVTINFDSPATKEAIEKLMAEIGYPVEK
jgi:copper ion binding protein